MPSGTTGAGAWARGRPRTSSNDTSKYPRAVSNSQIVGSARLATSACTGVSRAANSRSMSARSDSLGTPPNPSPAILFMGESGPAYDATPPANGITSPSSHRAVPAAIVSASARSMRAAVSISQNTPVIVSDDPPGPPPVIC
ncbi:Uncharacterised protein [Mycobacteroides abscessus subsp. massiliense]|nr:Uncharacterised protein [Mycobacteroides abscessus subsp. massiliense]